MRNEARRQMIFWMGWLKLCLLWGAALFLAITLGTFAAFAVWAYRGTLGWLD